MDTTSATTNKPDILEQLDALRAQAKSEGNREVASCCTAAITEIVLLRARAASLKMCLARLGAGS